MDNKEKEHTERHKLIEKISQFNEDQILIAFNDYDANSLSNHMDSIIINEDNDFLKGLLEVLRIKNKKVKCHA